MSAEAALMYQNTAFCQDRSQTSMVVHCFEYLM